MTASPTPAASTAAVSPRPSAPASASVAPRMTLVAERFAPAGSHPEGVFQVAGATLVTEGARVGRVVGEAIEPVGEVPWPGAAARGRVFVSSVSGRWPDRIDAIYIDPSLHLAEPSYAPLTGTGKPLAASASRGVQGIVVLGDTTLLAVGSAHRELRLVAARGPEVPYRPMTRQQAGCEPGTAVDGGGGGAPALVPESLHVTAAGTLLAFGVSCHHQFAAEVWRAGEPARLVALNDLPGGDDEPASNRGDETWVMHAKDLVRYRDGSFARVKGPGVKWADAFFSPAGQLVLYNHEAIYRRDGGRWTLLARVAWPTPVRELSIDEAGTFWASTTGDSRRQLPGAVYRLRPG